MIAYALGLEASGLWLKWGEYMRTEEGARTARQLRRNFLNCQNECLVKGRTAGSLNEFKLCLQKLFPGGEAEKILFKSEASKKKKLALKAESQKIKKKIIGGREVGATDKKKHSQSTKNKSLKFKNIKK